MNKNLITGTLGSLDPVAGIVSKSIYGIFEKEKLLKEDYYNDKLGFNKIELDKEDIKFVEYFLMLSRNKGESFECISVLLSEISSFMKIPENDFNDICSKLGSCLIYTPTTGQKDFYQLEYSLFWETDYLEKKHNSLCFNEILNRFINFLYVECRHCEEPIAITEIINNEGQLQFEDEHLNSILQYSLNYEVVKNEIKRGYDCKYIFNQFMINQSRLKDLYNLLNEKI